MSDKTNRHPSPKEYDVYARIIQIIGLFGILIMIGIDQLVKETEIPIWIYFGILGVAVGLSPEQMLSLIRDLIKSMVGRKNG